MLHAMASECLPVLTKYQTLKTLVRVYKVKQWTRVIKLSAEVPIPKVLSVYTPNHIQSYIEYG